MGFTSVDSLVAGITNEKFSRSDWQNRTVMSVSTVSASVGIDLSTQPSLYGSNNTYPGTALNWVSCNDSTGNGTQVFGIPHGGNVTPNTKHIISISAITPPAGLPVIGGTLVLVDLQGYWPGISHATTSAQTLVGTPTLRYPNGDGCRLYTVATTAIGATAQNIRVFYNNQANVISNSGLIAARASSVIGQVSSCFPSAAPSLYLPLVNGDTGVANVANISFSAASTGNSALCLARPLVSIPLTTAVNYITEREFVYQTPSMPRIYDGACLVWLYFSGVGAASTAVANAVFTGHIETAWN